MPAPPPLPVRDGVSPTRLRVPADGPWAGIADYIETRFDHLDPRELRRRISAGEIVGANGRAIDHHTPLGTHEFVWYHRDLPDEPTLPYREEILYRDDHLVVVDKPHFLPTTPSGHFLRETALVRLRTRLGNDDITPIHRLDRETAGVVMFSARPDTRGATRDPPRAHPVAARRAARHPPPRAPAQFRDPRRRARDRTQRLRAARRPHASHAPHGRLHQLRVHLAALGIGILGDRRYPDLLPEAPDDPDLPLQLLARELGFTDPVTGEPRRFATRRTLTHAPVSDAAGTSGA